MKNRITGFAILTAAAFFSCSEPAGQVSQNTDSIANSGATAILKKDSTLPPIENKIPVTDTMAVKISGMLQNKLLKDDTKDSADTRLFVYGLADINGDDNKEIFVLLHSTGYCGSGGCTAFLLSSSGEKIARFTVSETPISVAGSKTKGWNDLVITSRGQQYLVKYNGKTYPGNPTVQPEYKGAMDTTQIIIPQDAPEHTY